MSRRVDKPWGWEEIWAETERYVGKTLYIRGGHQLSLQHHTIKEESIRVLRGTLVLTVGAADGLHEHLLQPGDTWHIPPGTVHRMRAEADVEILEVSTPELDDVVRHQDDYGRAGS